MTRTMKEIAQAVAEQNGLTLQDLLGRDVRRKFSQPRQDAYAAIRRERPDLSYPKIGAFFGRDHSTVMYGERASYVRGAK